MRIQYENKFLDILLFNAIHQLLSPAVQIFFLLGTLIIVLITWQTSPFRAIIAGFIFYIVIWMIQLIFNIFYLYSKKDKAILTKHIIEIQDEALYEETMYNRSYFYWNGVVKVVRRPGFVAVYVTKHMAHIIPVRSFASVDEQDKFIKMIKDKIMIFQRAHLADRRATPDSR